jgi:hypothetical protein
MVAVNHNEVFWKKINKNFVGIDGHHNKGLMKIKFL